VPRHHRRARPGKKVHRIAALVQERRKSRLPQFRPAVGATQVAIAAAPNRRRPFPPPRSRLASLLQNLAASPIRCIATCVAPTKPRGACDLPLWERRKSRLQPSPTAVAHSHRPDRDLRRSYKTLRRRRSAASRLASLLQNLSGRNHTDPSRRNRKLLRLQLV